MAKKLLVDPNQIVGDNIGHQITEVVDTEFEISSPWYWVDGDDSYTAEKGSLWYYWVKLADNTIVTKPDFPGVDAPAGYAYQYNPVTNTYDLVDDPSNLGPQEPVIT